MGRLIDADNLKKDIAKLHVLHDEKEIRRLYYANPHTSLADFEEILVRVFDAIEAAPTINVPMWIPCSERLPKIGERVLLATNCGTVVIGHRDKPDLIWQVTEKGDKHWVYDPEAYTDDVDSLPKGEDCAFSQDTDYGDGFLSVTSLNYNPRFEGVIAWMPLPEPWKGADDGADNI